MTCNDERCLPPTDAEFELFATGGSTGDAGKKGSDQKATATTAKAPENVKTGSDASAEKKKITENTSVELTQAPPSTFSNVSVDQTPTVTQSSGVLKPVKWTFRSEKTADDTYVLVAEAKIDEGWNIYGQGVFKEGGPVPTSLVITPGETVSVEGQIGEQLSLIHISEPTRPY